jgi:hypothetical protein
VLDWDAALAELTRRFFTSHGPATVNDFAWWSGLKKADVRAGLDMVKAHLVKEVIDGIDTWRALSIPDVRLPSPTAFLLPAYDEYTIAYKDHSAILDDMYLETLKSSIFFGVIVIDGQVLGNWKRTLNTNAVLIEYAPLRDFTPAEDEALVAAAVCYGEFVRLPVELRKA